MWVSDMPGVLCSSGVRAPVRHTACGGLRPRAHDGVGVEVDPRSEEAADASEGVVEPREVCGRVHPQQLLGRRVGFRLVDAQLCGRVQDVW